MLTDEEFSSAYLKTRKGLHSTSLNFLTKGAGASRSLFEEVGEEYPLSLAALQTIEANEILADNSLLLEETADRLAPLAEAGSHQAIHSTFLRLENEINDFETQKRGVPYLTKAATVNPEAMIRMGEVQEQGFYGVKANPKRAKAYYDEGIRILSLLASQGLPKAAAELGHVYIEGLGTKQDIPRATRYFEFARKAGFEHLELWLWEHYGLTMRQVAIPEKVKEQIRNVENARTCIYLVREKVYGERAYNSSGQHYMEFLNLPVWYIISKINRNTIYEIRFHGYFIDGKSSHPNFSYKSGK